MSQKGLECAREWQREVLGARESNTEPERARGRKREPDSESKLAKVQREPEPVSEPERARVSQRKAERANERNIGSQTALCSAEIIQ